MNIKSVLAQEFNPNDTYQTTKVPGEGSTTNPPATNPIITTAPSNNPPSFLQNPLKAKSVSEVLALAVDLAIFIGGMLAVLVFIFIGFKFVLAQGNEAKLKSAKEWFLWAVVGTAILISSKVIVEVVRNTLISTGVVNEKLFNNKP